MLKVCDNALINRAPLLELSCAGIDCHADIGACLAWGGPVRYRPEWPDPWLASVCAECAKL
eukprot:459663-Prymnesium_polylepis.1